MEVQVIVRDTPTSTHEILFSDVGSVDIVLIHQDETVAEVIARYGYTGKKPGRVKLNIGDCIRIFRNK